MHETMKVDSIVRGYSLAVSSRSYAVEWFGHCAPNHDLPWASRLEQFKVAVDDIACAPLHCPLNMFFFNPLFSPVRGPADLTQRRYNVGSERNVQLGQRCEPLKER